MLNSLRDGQINYGTTNCSSAHVPPHNVVAPIHQNSLIPTEPTTPVVYPWNSNPRLDHLYGFHSRYYNLDYPTPYPPATNQYVPANMYGQNVPQCCQPCCRLRSQNIPKTSPPQVLYNPIRPVQQLNRSYKSKKTLKTPCSEQFLPYIPNDLPVKYDTQNCYQQKYSSSYLSNTNYCPPANNLWIPPAANPTWPTDRLRPIGRHSGVVSHDYSREKNYQRLPNYQSNPYPNPTSNTHKPYNYIPPIPDVHDYRSSVYHNPLKNNTSEYISHEQNSRLPILSQNNQSSSSYLQQYYNAQPVQSYPDVQRPSEPFKPPQITPQNSTKSNLNVREFLATWDEGEEETNEKSSDAAAPIVVLDCMTLEGDALTKIQEKLNVVSYENLEKVLKENQNPLVINTEPNEVEYINNKSRLPSKSNFEPLDYTKRETGIIKPFINEKKTLPETNSQPEKSYSVNFDGMVAWYGKKNTDISSTDLIERLADRIFNLSKSQESEGVSFGTAAYTGQITQTNRSIASSIKDSSKFIQNQQLFNLHHTDKCIEPSVINKIDCNNDHISRISSCVLNESNKASTIKSNHMNSSCIVENITKKCLNVTNEESTPWNLDQGSQEQHLNMSLYDHSVIIKPLDFSSLTDETKGNPFVFEKPSSSVDKSNNGNDEFNKVLNENSNYNSTVSNNQHSIHQMDSSNRNFPVIVSPNIHRQEYNGFHESVIQRTGCDKNKHDKVPAQTDFESINWNISNDLDKIMKNTSMTMEPSCLYDRHNYNILDNINSDKNVSAQWKDSVPCVDLTVSSKVNTNHDSFFDSWNFIESYESHSSKKINNPSTNNNEMHSQLFPNQINSLVESNIKNNIASEKVENETLTNIKDLPFSKPNDMSSNNNTRSRDVFNLNNRIPDFSDGFELPVINEPHDYMPFKKPSNDTENRTDGSIFEHFTEPKCIRTANEITNIKNDQNKSDMVGLPNFKDKEPLAPMPVPPKLNIVKPIIRDPSQIYSVIKQKLKYDNSNVVNDSAISNKTGHRINDNQTNVFSVADFKSKYNSVQLNQFDVWSEKFVLKGDSNRSSSALVQCDVEITQFKSTPENRNSFISKSKINENYQEKDTNLSENINGSNLTSTKIDIIENKKINSGDFLHCLESTKTDDQKYRDTLDEFETSFGFDMHCNNESNKSFHEGIVDKCLEERIQDQIGEHNINNTPDSNNTSINSTSNNTRLPFECDFQSGYLIKNYFDENKNKAILFDQKEIRAHQKSVATDFNYHSEIQHDFEYKRNTNLNSIQCSEKNSNFNILNDINRNIKQSQSNNENENFNFIVQDKSKHLFVSVHENSHIAAETSIVEKNNIGCLTIENRNFEFENEEKNILDLTNSKRITVTNYPTEAAEVSKINDGSSNEYKLSKISKHSSVDFDLSIDNTNIFESNSSTLYTENKTETSELENNKNTFESTFNSENVKNIENHINGKSIFELENNNSDMYQTQNLEKIHEFDFETRIIQNLEIECSNSNVHEPTTPKETYGNENKIKSMYDYDIINEDNNAQNEINIEHFSCTPEKTEAEETSNSGCNNGTDLNDVMDTDQGNIVDRVFEDDFTAENNIDENPISETHNVLDGQNKNAEENNLKKCDTENNSNLTNNTKIHNIFDNVTNLNIEKDDSNLSENYRQNDDKCTVSESQNNVEDQHLQIVNTETVYERDIEKKMDETLKTSNNFLLQEFEDNSCSSTTSVSSSQSEHDLEEENNGVIMPKECNSKESNEYILNVDENILDTSNKTVVYENTAMLEKQRNTYIKQSYIELINQNNIQTIKNNTVEIVQGDVSKNTYENIKSDLLHTIENTNKTLDNNDGQSNYSNPNLLNKVELIYQKQSSEIVESDNLACSEPSSLNYLELICQRYSSDIEVKEKITSKRSSSNIIESKYQHSNNIEEVDNSINLRSSSLNLAELTYQKYSEKIVEAEVAKDVSNNNLDNVQSTCLQHSNNNVEVEDSTNSEPVILHQPVLTFNKHSNEVVECSTNIKSSQLSVLKTNDDSCIKNTADSENVDEDRKLPRVKFILKSHSKSMTKTNIFDEETKKSSVVKDVRLSARHIFKNRNKLYKPWKFIYRRELISNPREIVKEIGETECPVITTNADSISQNLKLPNCVDEESISLTEFNQEQCSDSVTIEQCSDSVTNEQCSDSVTNEQCSDSVTNEQCSDSVAIEQGSDNVTIEQGSDNVTIEQGSDSVTIEQCPRSVTNEHQNESLNFSENQEIDNSAFVGIDDQPYEVFSPEDLSTPVPSPFDDFRSETSTPDYCGGEEYWDKSLENEYNTVLHKTISKLAKHRVNIRDKFNIRLLARRVNEMKQMKRCRRRFDKMKRVDNKIGRLADIAIVECPATTVLRWNVMAVKTADPVCKIKVQLPWGRIFNFNSQGAEDHQRTKYTKLELGPAKVEVRLSRTPGDWQVAACRSMMSPKSVVSVKRLVLQRATSPAKDPDEFCSSPVKDCDETRRNAMNCDAICSNPAKDCDGICSSSVNDSCNSIVSSPSKDSDVVCNSPIIYYDDSCSSSKKDYDESCSAASDSSSGGSCSSSNTGPQQECSRKLPKIVIRRNGQNNNYTSYVSSNGFEGGDDGNDGTPQLMVRLVRDRKLDEMAAGGVTTLHLRHLVPISESAADTHDAKRARYT